MKSGFTDFVATRLIPDNPGQTARWYAREYLQLGDNLSDAKNPEESLANTLDKQVRREREHRIRRERIDGKYRFFPVIAPSGLKDESKTENIVIQISLSQEKLTDIDNLITVDRFKNRNDVIKWLVNEGIKVNRNDLDKEAEATKQIEQMKRLVVSL